MSRSYIVYKVVLIKDSDGDQRYVSYNGVPGFTLTYTLGELIEARIGELFCFKEMADALSYVRREFSFSYYNAAILICETECEPKPLDYRARVIPEEIFKFWKGEELELDAIALPKGTVTVKSLTPKTALIYTSKYNSDSE